METKRLTIPEAEELLGQYYPIHKYGYVALKSYMGGDAAIEEAARNSYQYGTRKRSDTRSLIRYLYRKEHTSPFEHVEFQFHMSMPIFVARQIVRTRTASLNEMSGRYSEMPEEWYTPDDEEILRQDTVNKQGSTAEGPPINKVVYRELYDHSINKSFQTYRNALSLGVSREMARIVLPLSTMTNWVWKIDGNNLLKTLTKRCDPQAQPQTREYFMAIAGMVKRIMPLTFEAWEDYTYYAASFSDAELRLLRSMLQWNNTTGVEPTNADKRNALSMSAKEQEEFHAKLLPKPRTVFDLDMSKLIPREQMELYHGNSKRT